MTQEKSAQASDISLASSTSSPMSDSDSVSVLNSALLSFQENINFSELAHHASAVCDAFDYAICEGSPIAMLPNYQISPSGEEHGEFLVMDLGGSTLRVAVISITPPDAGPRKDRISVVISKKWSVENTCKVVNKRFFQWIAEKIHETLMQQSAISPSSCVTTGITWSFSLESTSYNTAKIFNMGKGYVVSEEIYGRELKQLLEETILQTHGIKMNVQSIINDSLAVYSAGRFLDSNTMLALVLGTGLNLCCQLKSSPRISPAKLLHNEDHVLFNTETSLFGNTLVRPFATKYDCIIDPRFADCPDFLPHMTLDPKTNTIFQPFELLASGRYLPELVRLVLVEAISRKEIFTGQKNLEALSSRFEGFTGELMCFISESSDNVAIAREIEKSFHWASESVNAVDVVNLQVLVNSVIRRAAFIVAIAIVAYIKLLARHNGQFETQVFTIGYVGSVMEYFVNLRNMTLDFVNSCPDIQNLGVEVRLQFVNESSLLGSAIAAASRA